MTGKYTQKRSKALGRPHLGSAITRASDSGIKVGQVLVWTAIGGVAAVALWPDKETGTVLGSRAECGSAPVARAECELAYDQAFARHQQVAPRFDDRWQCEEQFRDCEAAADDSRFWIPPFGGFLLGYRERDGGSGYYYRGSVPLYRERNGGFLNPNGDYVRTGYGRVTGKAGDVAMPARAITISRAGFGSTAGARSSFGG